MANKDIPFFPLTTFEETEKGNVIQHTEKGATKHEQVAASILQGMVQNPNTKLFRNPQLAKDAFYLAEELLNLFEQKPSSV